MQEQPFLLTLLQTQQLYPSCHCSSCALPTTSFPSHLKMGELSCCLAASPCSWSLLLLVCPALLCHCRCSRWGCCSCRSLVAQCSFSCHGKWPVRRELLLPALMQLESSSLFQRRMRKQLFGCTDFTLLALIMREPHKMTSLQVTAPRLRDIYSTLKCSGQLWRQGACHRWVEPLMSLLEQELDQIDPEFPAAISHAVTAAAQLLSEPEQSKSMSLQRSSALGTSSSCCKLPVQHKQIACPPSCHSAAGPPLPYPPCISAH